MEDKKIDILMNENQNIRTELTAILKNIHNCLFSFIGILGLFGGILLSFKQNGPIYNDIAGILAFLISQIGIIIIIFAISLLADVAVKAAYISYIERKLNTLVGENIIFWESKVTAERHAKGVTITSQRLLFLFYFIVFLYLTWFTYNKQHNYLFLFIQIGELIIIAFLSFQLKNESSITSKYIRSLESNKPDVVLIEKKI